MQTNTHTNMTMTIETPAKTSILSSWDDAAVAIKTLAEAQTRLTAAEQRHRERLAALQAKFEAEVAQDRALAQACTQDLTEFATEHRADFGTAKSRPCGTGLLGWRASTSLELVAPERDVIAKLKALLPDCVRTKITESVDKVRLKAKDPDLLAKAGCENRTTETFYIETAPALISTSRVRVEVAE